MTNVKSLKRICENMTGAGGCAKCPCRKLCESLDDLMSTMGRIYDRNGSCPDDWSMFQTARLHKALTKVLYEMDVTNVEVNADMEDIRKEADDE